MNKRQNKIKELEDKLLRAYEEIENLKDIIGGNLYRCRKCGFLVKSGYICLKCGEDNSIPEDTKNEKT